MKYPSKVIDLCQFLEDKGAEDIYVCNIQGRNVVDYIIVSTLHSTAHIQGVKDYILEECAKLPLVYGEIHVEGFNISSWVVLDVEDIFVHLFTKEEREKYNFDRLISDGGNMVSLKKMRQEILVEENKRKIREEREYKARHKLQERKAKKGDK